MRRLILLLVLSACGSAAQAQLYRWIDPESGSTKFSSYPPPWLGDPARERRAPKVEVIPPGKPAPPQRGDLDLPPPALTASPAAAPADPAAAELAARFRLALTELSSQLVRSGGNISPELQKRVDEFTALSEKLDRADPAGATARQAEMQAAMQAAMQSAAQAPRGAQPR